MSKIERIISEVFNLPVSEINSDLTPDDIEIWDSLSQLLLIDRIESDFDIILEIEEIFSIFKIGDIFNILSKKNCDLESD